MSVVNRAGRARGLYFDHQVAQEVAHYKSLAAASLLRQLHGVNKHRKESRNVAGTGVTLRERIRGHRDVFGFLKAHPYAFLGAIVFFGMAFPTVLKDHNEWDEVYLDAARQMAGGLPVYPHRHGFVYPPFVAWFAIPLAYLPTFASRTIWYAVNVSSMIWLVNSAWRLTGGDSLDRLRDSREHTVAALGLLCGLTFAFNALSHHQTDLVIGALGMSGCLALARSRAWPAALCFGIAAGIKGPAGIWVGFLLWRRRWGTALGVVAVAVGINLLPDIFTPAPDGNLWLWDWFDRVIRPVQATPGCWYADPVLNQSLTGGIFRWVMTQWTWSSSEVVVVPRPDCPEALTLKTIQYASALGLFLATLAVSGVRPGREPVEGSGKPSPFALECSMVFLLALLLSPMSGKAHFAVLVLPGFCLARLIVTDRNKALAGLFVLALFCQLFSMRFMGACAWVGMWYGALSGTALLHLLGCGYAYRGYPGLCPAATADPIGKISGTERHRLAA